MAACGIGPASNAWVHAWTVPQSNWHINIRELWAVYHSLLTWGALWANHDVAFAVDNSVTVSWINSGTARSTQAMSLLRKIFWLVAWLNIRINAVPAFLTRGDVDFVERGAVLHLRFTKTNQFPGPPIDISIPTFPKACFSPVISLKCLFALVHTSLSAPLFSFGPDSWITYNDLRTFIRFLAQKCGRDPD